MSDGRLDLRLHVPEPPENAQPRYRLSATAQPPGGKAQRLRLKACGTGCFTTRVTWHTGTTVVRVGVRAQGWLGDTVTFVVPWPVQDGSRILERVRSAMARQPQVNLTERVTSNTRGEESMSSDITTSGRKFLDVQPYRTGLVGTVAVLLRGNGRADIGFALAAEGVYVRLAVDAAGRILSERTLTPNHLITRAFTYP